jgi:hypothetical protein
MSRDTGKTRHPGITVLILLADTTLIKSVSKGRRTADIDGQEYTVNDSGLWGDKSTGQSSRSHFTGCCFGANTVA